MAGFSDFGRWFLSYFNEEIRTTTAFARASGMSFGQAKRLLCDDESESSPKDRRGDALVNFLRDAIGLRTVKERRDFLVRLMRRQIPTELRGIFEEIEHINEKQRAQAEISDRALRRICDVLNASDESSAAHSLHRWAERMSPSRIRAIAQVIDEYQEESKKTHEI